MIQMKSLNSSIKFVDEISPEYNHYAIGWFEEDDLAWTVEQLATSISWVKEFARYESTCMLKCYENGTVSFYFKI